MKYRMYIDEVGNQHLQSSDIPNERYLSLTGVIASLEHVQDVIHPQMEELKNRFFRSHPDDPVVFHRKEMVNGRGPFHTLRDLDVRKQFDNALLGLLQEWEYCVITICLDKKAHLEKYSTWVYAPYHYCLEMLLERYVFFLDTKNARGDVLAESRGGKEDMKLKNCFRTLYSKGGLYLSSKRIVTRLTSCELKVKPKAFNVAGLQISDILAHTSRNEILRENDRGDFDLKMFAKRLLPILRTKYYQGKSTIYGKKLI